MKLSEWTNALARGKGRRSEFEGSAEKTSSRKPRKGMRRKAMFMEPELTNEMEWHEIDGASGTFVYPGDSFSLEETRNEYEERHGEVYEAETITGYGVRLSASGYMDATEWAVYPTPEEALDELLSMYVTDDSPGDRELYDAIKDIADQIGVQIDPW